MEKGLKRITKLLGGLTVTDGRTTVGNSKEGDMMTGKCIVAPIIMGDPITGTKLRVAHIAGHQVVVGDHYEDGALGFHIPHGTVLPLFLLEDMWLVGKLAGKDKNRVKAREIHGVFSDGLVYGSCYFLDEKDGIVYHESRSWDPFWAEGQDVAELLINKVGEPYITFR